MYNIIGATVRIQSTDIFAVEGNERHITTVNVCLDLVDVWAGLERELQFQFFQILGTAGNLVDTVVVFPATSVVGDSVCQQYTIVGDDVKEEDERFIVSVQAVNSIDTIDGLNYASVTVLDDGDCELHIGQCKG